MVVMSRQIRSHPCFHPHVVKPEVTGAAHPLYTERSLFVEWRTTLMKCLLLEAEVAPQLDFWLPGFVGSFLGPLIFLRDGRTNTRKADF
jgi:hypothetical protein